MIIFLTSLKNKPIKLFICAAILGITAEYAMSYICEKIFHFKWWDYSNMALNINGRICLYFTIMWGALGVFLIRYFNPLLDKVIDFIKQKVDNRILKTAILIVIGFLIFDASISAIALKSFYAQIIQDFDLDLTTSEYADLKIENDLFSEENMLLIYPNIQIAGTKYNNTYVDSLYTNKKTYYFKVFEPKVLGKVHQNSYSDE